MDALKATADPSAARQDDIGCDGDDIGCEGAACPINPIV
jgi:hypothetical protein